MAGSPLEELCALASAGRSGEFVCADVDAEVHVYLQRGSVAWATDSGHPFVFRRQLTEQGLLDLETFREVLDECRRSRKPLGETLVAWGLVSREQVREALRHQVSVALETLMGLPQARCLFLPRTYGPYDEGFTFELGSLLPALARVGS